ncbi:MAG: DNA-binding protein WhiA [Lachnospiraceae bacterium]|nr:DNA-binding protein WhiA [Lachnospiraceae bacterium]
MSFSQDVKEELSKNCPSARHCQIAEVAGMIGLTGRIVISAQDRFSVKIQSESLYVARKYFTLLKKTFNIVPEVTIRKNSGLKNGRLYIVTVNRHEDAVRILQTVKLLNSSNEIEENLSIIDNVVIMKSCCKRAFIRGAFLAAGSVSDPNKAYHFEIVCNDYEKAVQLQKIINNFEIESKIVERKNHFVVYIKEGSSISDILNVMEAHVALMEFENVRILKDMRNSVNRKVNCETANLNKTVSAAMKQIESIELIKRTKGLDYLPAQLKEIAVLRVENPEVSLKELGEMLEPKVGKSGVNHRLRKICEIADSIE